MTSPVDHKRLSSSNLQHEPSFDSKGLDSLGDPLGEQEGIVQLEVEVVPVTEYQLYKRRWIGLGGSPLASVLARWFHSC